MAIDLGTILTIAGVGANIFSSISAGNAQADSYTAESAASFVNARRALIDAVAYEESGQAQAVVTRRQGVEVRSQARGDFAASGVNVNTGSARDVQMDITRRAEEDALNQILYGQRQGARQRDEAAASEAEGYGFIAASGKAKKGGNIAAVGNLFSGGADVYRAWRAANP